MLSLMLLKLTFQEIIADIPHDGAAIVVYLLLAAFVAGIWYGSRPGRRARTEASSGVE